MSRAGVLCLFLSLSLDRLVSVWAGLPASPPLAAQDVPEWQSVADCARANELCAAEPSCSSSYRTLRQCVAGRDHHTLLGNKECQGALEVLQRSSLYGCRCKRGMKKELLCLQIYWGIHSGLAGGEEFYEASPYEPIASPRPDVFRLAAMVSGVDQATGPKHNHCLDATKACNLNDSCKRLRSAYIATCNSKPCNRRKCHKALRQFFDQVPSKFTYRLLFCACEDQACAERRRQTIVPECSYAEKEEEKPNCLALRRQCRQEPLCRSRLADFHSNCQAFLQSSSGCSRDHFQACLASYTGLIGLDVTPNYVDSSAHSLLVSPFCSCRGSGNMEEECEGFLKDFTENPCLWNTMVAFGNGTDPPKPPLWPLPTQPPTAEQASSSSAYSMSGTTTCSSTGKLLVTALAPEQNTSAGIKGSVSQLPCPGTFSAFLFLLVEMAL